MGFIDVILVKFLFVGICMVDMLCLVWGFVEMEFVVIESCEVNKLVIRIGMVFKFFFICIIFLFGFYEIFLFLCDRVNGSDMFSG